METQHTIDLPWLVSYLKYWGQLIPAVQGLICLMGIDIVLGVMLAINKHTLNSTTSFSGMSKKVAVLLFVVVGKILEPFSGGVPVALMIAMVYFWREMISIVENMAGLGVPIPEEIAAIFKKIREQREEKLDQRSTGSSIGERNIIATQDNTAALNKRVDQESKEHIVLPLPVVAIDPQDPQ